MEAVQEQYSQATVMSSRYCRYSSSALQRHGLTLQLASSAVGSTQPSCRCDDSSSAAPGWAGGWRWPVRRRRGA
jgi:hypothetical protein